MKLTNIQGIPTGIVNNHNEVLFYWVKSGIKKATLFRVDAHHDMVDWSDCHGPLTLDSYKDFHIANFNCPAVYHEIIDSIYWLNPHSKKRKLQDLGTSKKKVGRVKTDAVLLEYATPLGFEKVYVWSCSYLGGRIELMRGEGKVISPEEINKKTPLITDFDLDGFCCHRRIDHSPWFYFRRVSNFERRIDDTIKILKDLPTPDLITIARSQGKSKYSVDNYADGCYVPHDKVDKVQECLIERLKEIY